MLNKLIENGIGIFIQIGLYSETMRVPRSEHARGTLFLNARNELRAIRIQIVYTKGDVNN